MPLSSARISLRAWALAAAAAAGQADRPLAAMSKPGTRLADCTVLLAQNSAEPFIERLGGKRAAPLRTCTASALRPAQPVPPEPFGSPACICTIWSLCEYRLLGSLAVPARYQTRAL